MGFKVKDEARGWEMRLRGPGRLVNDLDYGVGSILDPVL